MNSRMLFSLFCLAFQMLVPWPAWAQDVKPVGNTALADCLTDCAGVAGVAACKTACTNAFHAACTSAGNTKQNCELQEAVAAFKAVGGNHLGDRLYHSSDFPSRLKCTSFDYRTFHLCIRPRFFEPSARVYFDTGEDDEGEVDIFDDGGLTPTIDFAALYVPWRLGQAEYFDSWSWGPLVAVGIGSSADDSEDGTVEASDVPVVMFSYGFVLEYELEGGTSFAFEIGRATGFSPDESLSDGDDSATYVGLKINVPTPSSKNGED